MNFEFMVTDFLRIKEVTPTCAPSRAAVVKTKPEHLKLLVEIREAKDLEHVHRATF